jgi:hypothetical protein
VLDINRYGLLTLQNLDNPGSIFETVAEKLESNGYFRISATPYVNLNATHRKQKHGHKIKLRRCPHTVDLFEGRADSEFPQLPQMVILKTAVDRFSY